MCAVGFEGMAWNRNVFGRLQNSDVSNAAVKNAEVALHWHADICVFLAAEMPQTSNLPQMLREMEVFERSRPGANTGDMKQLSRITLYVDDIAETQVLVRASCM